LEDGAELALFALRVDGPPRGRSVAAIAALALCQRRTEAPTRRMRLDFDEAAGFQIDQTPSGPTRSRSSVGPRHARSLGNQE